ncbi:MAG: gas vesicle structural protein GvpA [Syntrophomonadaceae bacterium]|nr:gas vesicle structural protein GvpA [Syntrophomonadaceae bacterium]
MAIHTSMGGQGLVEVIDRILEKGLVLDAWVRVCILGLELLTIEARVVVASVDTWLHYAREVGLLEDFPHPPHPPHPPVNGMEAY